MASNPFYAAYVEIIPETRNFKKKLSKDFDAVGADGGKRAGAGLSGGILGSVGRLAAPLAAAVATLGIGKMFADSISNASDLQEARTAITAVFGPADKIIQDFAKSSATALGQSQNATLDAARTFGVFGKAAGLSGSDLAGFSTDFITLSADLASFNNTTPEQAIQALGAGLRGESEPLRQFGILLDDATLKARATELGIYSGTGALTQQQKVLASQAEILAQTSVQQGDFARTSGGLANQQRILAAGVTNLSTQFGAILLPIMTTVVGFLNTAVVPALSALVDMLDGGETSAATAGFVAKFQPIVDFFQNTLKPIFDEAVAIFGPFFAEIGAAFAPLIPQILGLAAAFSPLSLIFQAIKPLLPQILDAFLGLATVLAGALGGALTTLLPAFQQLASVLVAALGQVLLALLPVIIEVAGILGPILSTAMDALMPIIVMLAGILGQLVEAVAPLISAVLGLVAPLVQLVGAILGPLIKLFAAILKPILGLVSVIVGALIPVIEFLVTVLAAIITGIVNVITWFVNLITGSKKAQSQFMSVWNSVLSFFGGIWENIIGFVSDGIADILVYFIGLPGRVLSALGDLGSLLLGSGQALIRGFIDGIKGMIGAVGDAVGGVMDFVGGFFPNSPAERGPFAGSGWTNLKRSGLAIGEQFGAGLTSSRPVVDMASMVSIPSVRGRFDFDGSAAGARSQPVDVRVELVPHDSEFGRAIDARVFVNNEQQTTVLQNGRRRL